MARGFRALVGRLQSGAVGGLNFRANVRSATKQTVVAVLRAAEQKPATRVTSAPATLRAALQRPATRVTQTISGTVKATQRAAARAAMAPAVLVAARQRTAARQTMAPTTLVGARQRAAGNIVQIKIDLNHASHVVTAANRVTNVNNWATPANMQGAPQGTRAGSSSFVGQLLLSSGTIDGTMVAQANRPSSLAIQSVHLDFYGDTAGLPIVSDLVSSLILGFFINLAPIPGTDTTLDTINVSSAPFLATPRSFRIDNGAGAFTDIAGTPVTWANIALIKPFFKAQIIANATGITYYADAVRLRVVASETQVN